MSKPNTVPLIVNLLTDGRIRSDIMLTGGRGSGRCASHVVHRFVCHSKCDKSLEPIRRHVRLFYFKWCDGA